MSGKSVPLSFFQTLLDNNHSLYDGHILLHRNFFPVQKLRYLYTHVHFSSFLLKSRVLPTLADIVRTPHTSGHRSDFRFRLYLLHLPQISPVHFSAGCYKIASRMALPGCLCFHIHLEYFSVPMP